MKNKSIKRVLERYPLLAKKQRGLPDIGRRADSNSFSKPIDIISESFKVYGNALHKLETKEMKNKPSNSLGGGSPMETKPFPMSIKKIKECLKLKTLFWYPLAAGDEEARKEILEYLKKENFPLDQKNITIDSIIFTVSGSHAFNMILEVIARPYDVILMTGPNYGLFAFYPERMNINVEIIDLHEEDKWYINPEKLENKIITINKKLKLEYENKLDYVPKVVAFLNENPHNPTGKVLSKKNKEILEKVGSVCLENGVFVIDDLIYRDLTFDRDNIALPMGTYPDFFSNTISLFGLSKSYGLAGIRAGMIVADPIICRGIRNRIFQTMDATPIIQAKALAGAYNGTKKRYKLYNKYFNPINKEYMYRFQLLKCLVEGIDSIEDSRIKKRIIRELKKHVKNKEERKRSY